MFDGKMKVFRSEGGAVKTDDEKRQMAEKHRFKKNREFKQRLEEQEQNEDADIRSFTFHRHDVFDNKRGGKSGKSEFQGRSGKGGFQGKPGKGGFQGKSGKPFKRRNRFDDDED